MGKFPLQPLAGNKDFLFGFNSVPVVVYSELTLKQPSFLMTYVRFPTLKAMASGERAFEVDNYITRVESLGMELVYYGGLNGYGPNRLMHLNSWPIGSCTIRR